jgi:endonuclease YncB( thermonuclease family)
LIAFGLLIGAALAQQAPLSSPPPRAAATIDRVVDGDTIVIAGERHRLLDIDAPELGHRADCPAEAALGTRSKIELIEAIAQTSVIEIEWDGRRDPFGRPLIVLLLDGTSAGALLVQQGLAVPHTPERHNWCGSE